MVAEPELEFAGAAVVLVMVDGNAVIQLQRAKVGNVQEEANAAFLFNDGNIVISGTEPVAVTANRLIHSGETRFARGNVAIFETAQRIKAAEIILVVERHDIVAQTVRHTRASGCTASASRAIGSRHDSQAATA